MLLDFGWPLSWPQSASPAELQPFVFNKAAEVTSPMPWYSLGRASLKNSPSSRTTALERGGLHWLAFCCIHDPRLRLAAERLDRGAVQPFVFNKAAEV